MSFDEAHDYVDTIATRLSSCDPIEIVPGSTAAVAVIFGSNESLLLIRRAEKSGDPWSGHVAFPGGRVQLTDESFFGTAAREAKEEVGLDVRNTARFLGYMESFEPRNQRVLVVPCVFQLKEEAGVIQNQEVFSYRWVPLGSISVGNRDSYILERGEKRMVLPAFRFEDYLVWGLTERILTKLMELAGITI